MCLIFFSLVSHICPCLAAALSPSGSTPLGLCLVSTEIEIFGKAAALAAFREWEREIQLEKDAYLLVRFKYRNFVLQIKATPVGLVNPCLRVKCQEP